MPDDARTRLLRNGGGDAMHWWAFRSATFSSLRTYLQDLEFFLAQQVQKERVAWKAAHDEVPMWGEYTDILPQILRPSFIVALVIEAEMFVKLVCTDVGVVLRQAQSFGSLKGSPFARAQQFLTLNANFKRPTKHMWTELETIWRIRGAIVHGDGKPNPKSTKRIARLVKKVRPSVYSPFDDLVGPIGNVDAKLCEHVLTVVEHGLKEIYDESSKFIFRVRDAEGVTSPYDDCDEADEG